MQSLATSAAATPAGPVSDLLSAIAPALTLLELPVGVTSIGSSATSISTGFTGVYTNFRGFSINADRDFYAGKGPFTGYGPGAANLPNWFFNGQGSVGAPSDAATASVSSAPGQATTVGRLSVPSAWTVAAPEIRPVAYTLPITSAIGGSGGGWRQQSVQQHGSGRCGRRRSRQHRLRGTRRSASEDDAAGKPEANPAAADTRR